MEKISQKLFAQHTRFRGVNKQEFQTQGVASRLETSLWRHPTLLRVSAGFSPDFLFFAIRNLRFA
jgi:hypothetical protein